MSDPHEPILITGCRPAGGGPPQEILVRDGCVEAVRDIGRAAAAGAGAGSGAIRRLDATGTVALPGFVDAHVHLLMAGLALAQVDLSSATDRASFEAAIARGHAALPAGTWLIASGWDEQRWGGALPDASWLRAAGDRPTVAWRMDIHAAVVNPAVLSQVDVDTPIPGGFVERDDAGAATGLLREQAAWRLVNPIVPEPSRAQRRAALHRAVDHALARGITAVGAMEYLRDIEDVIVPESASIEARGFRVRLIALDRAWPPPVEAMRAVPVAPGVELFGAKAFVDGTLGSHTAWMLEPYHDRPDTVGTEVELAADGMLTPWAIRVAEHGLVPCIHAIGDAAVRAALEAADAVRGLGTGVPVRLEHVQHVADVDVARLAGHVASVQPGHRIGDHAVIERRLGPRRAAEAFRLRAMADAGARIAFGSDWPVIDCDPIEGLRAAIAGWTRAGAVPSGSELGAHAALVAATRGAAAAIEPVARQVPWPDAEAAARPLHLRPGERADIVLLDRDPLRADWIDEVPRVVATLAGGRVAAP